MKKKEIKPALDALKTIKMPKIEDKELRNSIISDHLALLKEQKAYEAKIDDLRTAHLAAFEKETEEVQKIQEELREETNPDKKKALVKKVNSHTELFDAVKAFNKAVEDLGNEEITLPKPIDGEKFAEGMLPQENFNLGLMESVFPMFN